MADFSLADFANLDVSEIKEVRFEQIPQGVYEFEVTAADMAEGSNRDGDKRFISEVTVKILDVKSLIDTRDEDGKPIERDSLVGKSLTEKSFIDPAAEEADVRAAIGRIKAMVVDMGGVWGAGIVDNVKNLKGLTFTAKIVHQTDRDDKTKKYSRLRLTKRA